MRMLREVVQTAFLNWAAKSAVVDASAHARRFTATVGHLCRAIRKLSAITLPEEADKPLYRGVRGELPYSFWVRGELGMVCATDTAFMSTSRNRTTPMMYMDEHGPNVLWSLRPSCEGDTGFHHGADISLLSQFAGEREVLFPPLTMLRVLPREEAAARGAELREELAERGLLKSELDEEDALADIGKVFEKKEMNKESLSTSTHHPSSTQLVDHQKTSKSPRVVHLIPHQFVHMGSIC